MSGADPATDYYELTMRSNPVEILPGLKTELWAYDGIPAGPTIVATRGRPTVVRHINALPATHPTLGYPSTRSVHLHGSASLPEYDGYAGDVTKPGQYKDYHYPNFQDAGRSGTTTTGYTTPRRTHTWAWRRCTSSTTTLSCHFPSRTVATTCH